MITPDHRGQGEVSRELKYDHEILEQPLNLYSVANISTYTYIQVTQKDD